jgi:hypothetical protein
MDELGRYFPEERVLLYQPSALADATTLQQLLSGAGLTAIRLVRETRPHRFKSFEEYWEPFEIGGGRHGQLFVRLAAPAREAVRERVRKRMLPFFVHGEWRCRRMCCSGAANASECAAPNKRMQPTALRAAADPPRSAYLNTPRRM